MRWIAPSEYRRSAPVRSPRTAWYFRRNSSRGEGDPAGGLKLTRSPDVGDGALKLERRDDNALTERRRPAPACARLLAGTPSATAVSPAGSISHGRSLALSVALAHAPSLARCPLFSTCLALVSDEVQLAGCFPNHWQPFRSPG